ncbi:MAG: phenylalanine--tRNA ligase subunit beta [bacterium]|nr:phenylalanine--tRNA ligase subunit beta [bacterium]
MKVLLSWLREFTPVEGPPESVAEDLSDLGLAVEDMVTFAAAPAGIVIARVAGLRPHPDADRIQLVDVDAGDGELRQVCCGAFNMAVGDLVPLATVGTTMPSGLEIGRRRMRGEASEGMLCSAAELAMGADAEGIMILPAGLELGEDLTAALGVAGDVLFDLEVNPNRPDALSVVGVARDLAARRGLPFELPEPRVETTGAPAGESASVEILAPDLCGRFSVRLLRNASGARTPPRLARRLLALGMRPINFVVDLSNYVMLEIGQPSHAFDADLVPGGALGVRRAAEGEQVETLDGAVRTLTAGDGVIVDSSDVPIGIAGVMGGASTEISETTGTVLLEAAWWNPPDIARTSRRLGLRSEASARFEAGVDPEIAPWALERFAELAAPGGVTLAPELVQARGHLPPRPTVRVRTGRVNAILGTELTTAEMRACLAPIGFEIAPATEEAPPGTGPTSVIPAEAGIHSAADSSSVIPAEAGIHPAADLSGSPGTQPRAYSGEVWDVTVPSWRLDSSTEIDVIEEVGRLRSYSRIARTVSKSPHPGGLTARQRARRRVHEVLAGFGLMEAMPLPFLAPGDLERCDLPPDGITVTNPLVAEESVMRTSLRPGLLKAVAYNAARRQPGVALFEVGHVHAPGDGELPIESDHLAVALAGREAPAAAALWERFRRVIPFVATEVRNEATAGLHPTRSAVLTAGGETVGVLGEIDPAVAESFGIDERVAWLECDLGRLLESHLDDPRYRQPSRFPSSDIDLAFVIDDATPAATVEAALRRAAGEALVTLRLFDVFRDADRLGPECRSVAWRLRLQAADRTLTDAEVGEIRAACIEAAGSTGAALRD